jgi:hypothetical protein
MARIDWVLVCDLAYFDRHARMCTVGITTQLVVPSLPIHLRQIMMVAHVIDPTPGEQVDVGVAVVTPAGMWAAPSSSDNLHIEVAAEYILVTLRDLQLSEEGVYRFQLHLDDDQPAVVNVPVLAVPRPRYAEVH